MKASFLIRGETFDCPSVSDFLKKLALFAELGKEMRQLEDECWISPSSYCARTPYGTLSEILWNIEKNGCIEIGMRRQLARFFDKVKIFENNDCIDIEALRKKFNNDNSGYAGLSFENCSVNANLEVQSKKCLFKFHRHFLSNNPPEKDNFITELQRYFPNILFHDEVGNTLNGLHISYKKIFRTIIYHLTILNDDFVELYKEHHQLGTAMVCEMLDDQLKGSLIEVSRDSLGISELRFIFVNANGSDNEVYCHYHTKFKGYLESQVAPNQGDRIYFGSPLGFDSNNVKEKVPLGRIGRHRI